MQERLQFVGRATTLRYFDFIFAVTLFDDLLPGFTSIRAPRVLNITVKSLRLTTFLFISKILHNYLLVRSSDGADELCTLLRFRMNKRGLRVPRHNYN